MAWVDNNTLQTLENEEKPTGLCLADAPGVEPGIYPMDPKSEPIRAGMPVHSEVKHSERAARLSILSAEADQYFALPSISPTGRRSEILQYRGPTGKQRCCRHQTFNVRGHDALSLV